MNLQAFVHHIENKLFVTVPLSIEPRINACFDPPKHVSFLISTERVLLFISDAHITD